MTMREKVHRLIDELAEPELEAVIEFMASRLRENVAEGPETERGTQPRPSR
jgi:hypothetical protein